MTLSPDETLLLSCSDDYSLKVFKTELNEDEKEFNPEEDKNKQKQKEK